MSLFRNKASKKPYLAKKTTKLGNIAIKVASLSLCAALNCYAPKENHYIKNSEIVLVERHNVTSIPSEPPRSIDDAVEEYPFTIDSSEPEKKNTFALIQRAVAELRSDPSYKFRIRDEYIPLYMALVDAETDFQVDTISSDDPKKTWCRTISNRGAVGPGQIMPSSVPSSEPVLRGRSGYVKRKCRAHSRQELASLDVRFDPYKNIIMMVRNANESIAAFPQGTYTYYGTERGRTVVGRKSRFPNTLYSHTMRTASSRDRMLLAAAGFNRGIYSVMGTIAKRKPANTSELMRMLGATGGYAHNVIAMAGRYSRMIAKNPEYKRQLYAKND